MGDHYPSPALPLPLIPSPDLAAFRNQLPLNWLPLLIPYAAMERLGSLLDHHSIPCFYSHSLSYPTATQGCVHLLSVFLVFPFSHQIPPTVATSHGGKAPNYSLGVPLLVYLFPNFVHIRTLPKKMAPFPHNAQVFGCLSWFFFFCC